MKRKHLIFIGLKVVEVIGFCLINYLFYFIGLMLEDKIIPLELRLSTDINNAFEIILCYWTEGLCICIIFSFFIITIYGGFFYIIKGIINKNKEWADTLDKKWRKK